MTHVHTLFTEALRNTFSAVYPNDEWRSLKISMEYPASKDDYPGIWLSFDPIGVLRTVGIGHVENRLNDVGHFIRTRRWSFAGRVSFTIVTLSGLERYRIYDELVKIVAFGQQRDDRSIFRDTIEQDPFMMVTVNWDEIDQAGFGASQGTPWGGDEILYEATLQITCIGEFISDELKGILLPITGIDVYAWALPYETDPTLPGLELHFDESPPGSGFFKPSRPLVENPPGSGFYNIPAGFVESPPGSGFYKQSPGGH